MIQGVIVALVLSLLANAWLFHGRDVSMRQMATAEQLNKDTLNAAASCTASVDRLALDGQARAKRLEAAMGAVAPKVRALQDEANQAARARPDDPGNLCGSLERYLKGVIQTERKDRL